MSEYSPELWEEAAGVLAFWEAGTEEDFFEEDVAMDGEESGAGKVLQEAFNAISDIINAIHLGTVFSSVFGDDSSSMGAYSGVLFSAHQHAWDIVMDNGDLNEGQITLAEQCQSAGEDYLDEADDYDSDDYADSIIGNVEGAGQALGETITAISHVLSTIKSNIVSGLHDWQEALKSE